MMWEEVCTSAGRKRKLAAEPSRLLGHMNEVQSQPVLLSLSDSQMLLSHVSPVDHLPSSYPSVLLHYIHQRPLSSSLLLLPGSSIISALPPLHTCKPSEPLGL